MTEKIIDLKFSTKLQVKIKNFLRPLDFEAKLVFIKTIANKTEPGRWIFGAYNAEQIKEIHKEGNMRLYRSNGIEFYLDEELEHELIGGMFDFVDGKLVLIKDYE